MKLGQKLFKKDQSIWSKPIIEYDQQKMNELFSEIHQVENNAEKSTSIIENNPDISLETEVYLMLHS